MMKRTAASYFTIVVLVTLTSGASEPTSSWRAVAPMNVTREYTGLALMPDGKVLAVTGHPLGGKSLASAELYDPAKNLWTPTGSLNVARNGVDPGGLMPLANGKFLIAGGGNEKRSLHEAELYDYETETWMVTGPMNIPRCVHATTPLESGDVLVTGGIDWITEKVHRSAEIYDYRIGTWSIIAPMATGRISHRAVRLPDGRILVTGGNCAYPDEQVVANAEIYDPDAGVWQETTPMETARRGHAAMVLKDGRVLVAGGSAGHFKSNKELSAAEIYDPQTEKWTAVAPLREARWSPSESLLSDGRVLLVAGAKALGGARSSAELVRSGGGNMEPRRPACPST